MVLRRFVSAAIATLVAVAGLAGCSGDAVDSSTRPRPTTPMMTSTVTTTAPTSSPSGDLAGRIDEAKQLAVRDHDAQVDDLVVVTAEEVLWPDSSYGCPLTERTYEPGPFPGYLIKLAHGELEYTYMAAEDTELQECLFLE